MNASVATCPHCSHPWAEHVRDRGCLHGGADGCICMRSPPSLPEHDAMAARAERADRFILRETGKVYALLADATQDAERLHAESGRVQRVIAVHDEMAFFRAGDVAYESKGSTR